MSKMSRYYFTKRVYPNYLVLIYGKDRYYSYGNDKKILEYIKFKNNVDKIKKYKINYLILDNLDIIDKVKYDDSMYDKYLYLTYFDRIFDEIKITISNDML